MVKLLRFKLMLLMAMVLMGAGNVWGESNYEQLTSIADIDESAEYVLGIDGTGFHYEGTTSWGKTALPANKTPIYYKLTKASDGKSFTAQAKISGTTYYLQIPTSNTFSMATTTGTNTDIIIGTTQVSGTNYAVANKGTTTRHLRINGTSGLRSYAGTTGKMAFFYKVAKTVTISAVSNNTELGTVELSGSIITATPKSGCRINSTTPYTVTSGTATVAQNGNEFTVTATSNCTVQINFEAIPTHTASFSVNGIITTQDFAEGAAIEFPSDPSAIEGKEFVGWTSEAIVGTTDDAPEFVTSATMGNANVTFYAVFADVTSGTATNKTDELTTATFGNPSSYGDWSGKQAVNGSTAVYAGNSTTNSGSIQMRSNNGNSGIVSTTTGGSVKKVTVKWDGSTVSGRTLNIYGANTAYAAATDLYANNKQGTLLGTIVYGTSTELTVTGDYTFIGIRSNDGALYLEKISIDWLSGTPDAYSGYCTIVPEDNRAEAGLSFADASVTKELVSGYTGQALTNPNNVSPITWTSTDESVATVENGTVTLLAVGTTTIKAAFAGNDDFKKGEASYELTVQDNRETITLSFAEAEIELEMKDGTVAAPTLNGNTGNGTVTYSSDDTSVATVDSETGVVTAVAEGEAVITATVEGTAAYQGGTATFTVTVVDNYKKGSVNNPYTVAEARAAIDEGTGVTGVYATGIVSEIVTAFNSTYGNISYNISTDGTTSGDQLQAFRGKSFDGNDFASANDIQVGDKVVLYGNLKLYGSTYEFDKDNEVVSLKQPVAVSAANYRTFASVRAHDFTAVKGLTAYTASASEKKVSFTTVTKAVPAETGLLLKGEAATYYVPVVASADPVEGNALVGVTTSEEKPAGIFVLMNGAKGVGFYKTTNTFTLGANTAYLPASVGSRLFIGFNDDGEETTGINGVKEMKENRAIYNLRGMRVTTPSKGLYIIGGKKVVIK